MERYLKSKLENGSFDGVSTTRSNIMAAIKGKSNRSTEVALRLAFVRAGIRGWRLHAGKITGNPDFFFPKAKLAVFVDGCFWHGCVKCGHTPKTRNEYWKAKFQRNRMRDRRYSAMLRDGGIQVIRVWEHSLKESRGLLRAVERVTSALKTGYP